jgi:probable phosphoglycerate mutase
MEQAA